eukprot:4613888-Pyramimonas_sp.AAC.1
MIVKDRATGLPCFDMGRDRRVRIQNICELCGGQAMQLDDDPPRAGAAGRGDDRIRPYDMRDVKQGIVDLPNTKGGPTLPWTPLGPPDGAEAETWEIGIDLHAAPLFQ